MSDFFYDRLTQLDHSFLIYENPSAPMHVGATSIFEAGPLLRRDGRGVDIERIEEHVASRLHRIPRYRQRLAWTPLEKHPIWVDDARFNLRYHLRHARLPRPGDLRLLKRMAGRVFSQHLDRGKPLWELWVVEGLEGDRVAMLSKIHHCMIDGVSGADLLSVLLAHEPVEKPEPPGVWLPRPAPDTSRLARDEVARWLRAPVEAASAVGALVREEARQDLVARLASLWRYGAGSPLAPATPLNQPIGPYRRVDWLPMSLPAVRAVAHALGGTVNDVVLATTAGAVRRFLRQRRQEDVDDLDFRVMAPVSTRGRGDRGKLGNRVSAWVVSLPVGEPDARRRFEIVRDATAALKESRAALAADTLEKITEWSGPALFSLGSLLLGVAQPFNMVVTNVPGPRETLYLLGARMLEAHPMVPLLGQLATGIALFSYRDTLSWGFTADWDLVPDLHDLVLAVDHSFHRLVEVAETAAAAGPAPPAAAPTGAPRRARARARR